MAANRIVVVGGGAAGLIAAMRAAELGASVTLLEKNDRLGMKILISGGGKCNLTHAGEMETVRAAFRTAEARFLKPAFYRFSNNDFLKILHARGMETYTRPDGRIFPVEPANARDVTAALEAAVRAAGVRIVTGHPVAGLSVEDGAVRGAAAGGRVWRADSVVVATGGSSYPATGTTGDGWRWMTDLGHTLAPLRAALAPLYLEAARPDWSGVALRDVVLRACVRQEGKEYARWRGDLLFTHKGVSGPCALGVSREVAERMAADLPDGGILEVDLSPDIAAEQLAEQLRAEIDAAPRRSVGSLADRFVPDRLAESVLAACDMDAKTRGAHLSAKALNRFARTVKRWPLGGVRAVPLERGEVVAGGVKLEEVDPQTMASRVAPGLYLCGEILDIAGPVGGYNLQAAWSTGYVAGEAAAKRQAPSAPSGRIGEPAQ